VGTTDTDYDGPLDDLQCTPGDVAYLLDALNAAITRSVSEADVVGCWAGLRPLVRDAADERTADLSRRHRTSVCEDGTVRVTGGKLTTYRRMAAEAVDEVVRRLGRGSRHSPTRHLQLLGADRTAALREPGAATRLGVSEKTLTHLVDRYGSEARTVIAMMQADPDLGRPLVGGLPYLRAEAVYGVRYEMAQSLDDVLSRRTRCLPLDREAAAHAAGAVATLIAPELGWSAGQADEEAEALRAAVGRAVASERGLDARDVAGPTGAPSGPTGESGPAAPAPARAVRERP
jgi:glycerol-3-phosphate dehydrogenase